MMNANKAAWIIFLFFLLASVTYSQEKDSLLAHDYSEYRKGTCSDSTLLVLYDAHVITKESLDSARFVRLRYQLKYKFVLDFLRSTRAVISSYDSALISGLEQFSECFSISPSKPKGAIESFSYYLPYDLYELKSFDNRQQVYLLAASDGEPDEGLDELFLFDNSDNGHKLLDTLNLDERNMAQITFFRLNGHNIIRLHQSVHGTGYLDEQEILIAVIDKKFHNLFSTDLLQANDWTMPDSAIRENDFERWVAKIQYVDENGDGILDIKKDVSEDVINMDGVKDFDFRNGRVIRHVKSWNEVYIWDEKTFSFDLDKRGSTGSSH